MNGQSSVNNYTQYFVTTNNAATVHHFLQFLLLLTQNKLGTSNYSFKVTQLFCRSNFQFGLLLIVLRKKNRINKDKR